MTILTTTVRNRTPNRDHNREDYGILQTSIHKTFENSAKIVLSLLTIRNHTLILIPQLIL